MALKIIAALGLIALFAVAAPLLGQPKEARVVAPAPLHHGGASVAAIETGSIPAPAPLEEDVWGLD